MLNFIGRLHTFEPWTKQIKWSYPFDDNKTVELQCTSLENNENFCNSNPCRNDATCSDYHCDCKCGWKGRYCDISK